MIRSNLFSFTFIVFIFFIVSGVEVALAGASDSEVRDACEAGDPGGCYYIGMRTSSSSGKNIANLEKSRNYFVKGCELKNRKGVTTKFNRYGSAKKAAQEFIEGSCNQATSREIQLANLRGDPNKGKELYDAMIKADKEKNASSLLYLNAVREYVFSPCSRLGLLFSSDQNSMNQFTALVNNISRDGKFCVLENIGVKYTFGIHNVSDFSCEPESGNPRDCRFKIQVSCKISSNAGSSTNASTKKISKYMCAPYNGIHAAIGNFSGKGKKFRVDKMVFRKI